MIAKSPEILVWFSNNFYLHKYYLLHSELILHGGYDMKWNDLYSLCLLFGKETNLPFRSIISSVKDSLVFALGVESGDFPSLVFRFFNPGGPAEFFRGPHDAFHSWCIWTGGMTSSFSPLSISIVMEYGSRSRVLLEFHWRKKGATRVHDGITSGIRLHWII